MSAACRCHQPAARLRTGWDPARDEAAGEQCRAFGAAGVLRLPTRVRISWQDDRTHEAGNGRRHADAPLRVWCARGTTGGCGPRLAGRLHRVMGCAAASGRGARIRTTGRDATRLAQGGDHADATGLPGSQRRAVQRERDADRILRPLRRAPRRRPARRHDGGRRSGVSCRRRYWSSQQFKRETDTSRWKPTPCVAR